MIHRIDHTWKVFLAYLVCCRRIDCVQISLTSSPAVLGNVGNINCSATFRKDETSRELRVNQQPIGIHFEWKEAEVDPRSPYWKDEHRYTVVMDVRTDNMVAMSVFIKELGCADEGRYVCTAVTGHINSTLRVETRHVLLLKLQVPPSAPRRVTIDPQSGVVKENEWFDLQCSSRTAQDSDIRLQWNIYRGLDVDPVPRKDARVILQEVHNMSGVDFCISLLTSRLRLPVTRKDQNCYVACFVQTSEHKHSAQIGCDNQQLDLCAKTPKLEVHYGVSEESMQIYILPEIAITEGATISLLCHADGYPPANYTWSRPQPSWMSYKPRTITQLGNASSLIIRNFNSVQDSGVYKCTASNWVLGVEYFTASQEISVSTSDTINNENVVAGRLNSVGPLEKAELVLLGMGMTTFVLLVVGVLLLSVVCMARMVSHNRRSIRTTPEESTVSSSSSVEETESGSD